MGFGNVVPRSLRGFAAGGSGSLSDRLKEGLQNGAETPHFDLYNYGNYI
jgi:hypothetical protein